MRYVIKVCYDGTSYGGWQIQKNSITVQQRLEEVCLEIFGKKISVTASGRTDSGVHAAGQVCHFDAQTTIPADKIAAVFNAKLPEDISVLKSAYAREGFDANRSAKKKTYAYNFYLSPCRNPLKDRYAVWIKNPLDIAKLKDISGVFVGEHDFAAFMAAGSNLKGSTVRTVYGLNVRQHEAEITISVTGNGFLYNMVRIIAGTLVDIGLGRIKPESTADIIAGCERSKAGHTAPPQGLYMAEVYFDEDTMMAAAENINTL